MSAYPREAWERLGELLIARRVELDVQFRNRRAFAAAVDMEYRVLYDLERGRRTNFTTSTLRAVERAYGLAAGSVERTLAGGELEPAGQQPTPGPVPERTVVEIPADASPAEVAGMKAIQDILDAQQEEIRRLWAQQEQHARDMETLRQRLDDDHKDNGGRRTA